jgi:predicted double-glycine peptidase
LRSRYGAEGLKCQYRRFDSIDQLKGAGITLAVVRDRFLTDHCVAVLEVSDRMVTIADPVMGKELLSYENFAKIWRFSGIVLSRDSARSI